MSPVDANRKRLTLSVNLAEADSSVGTWGGLQYLATAVLVLDQPLTVLYANPAAEAMFGLPLKHLQGLPAERCFPHHASFVAELARATQADIGFAEHELELAPCGHSIAHFHCTATPAEFPGEGPALLVEFLPLAQKLRIDREEKLAEQQRWNRELIRNLAHEIKNPLGGIRGAAQLLERELPDESLQEFTQVIIQESDRLQSLLSRLLTPYHRPVLAMLNIHEVLERVRAVLALEFPHAETGLVLRRDYDTSLPELYGDKEQLIQAVLNIARNAAQALTDANTAHPKIILGTRVARQVTVNRMRHRLALSVGISDNGPGVPAALKDRIFYPLVSGREGGTGVGLSLAQDFVSQHGGVIEFESAPGATVFHILLPINESQDSIS